MKYVQEMSGCDPWTTTYGRLRYALVAAEVVEVPQQDGCRLPYLCSLLSQRREAHFLAMEEDEKRITKLIDSLVIN